MGMYLKTSSGWKNIKEAYLKNSTGWKLVKEAYIKTSTGWKKLFSSVTGPTTDTDSILTQNTDSTTWLITLTGKYYHWYNADTIDYKIERSIDAGTTWTTIDSGNGIVNPSIGTYETITHQLDDNPSDVLPNAANIYKFTITATDSSTSLSNSSADTETVYGPENISLSLVSKSYTTVDISWTSAPNAQKYLVYKKLDTASSYDYIKVISGTSTTIDSLSSNTKYDFQVIPITGVSNTYKGYLGNPAYLADITTEQVSAPTQISAPTKGSGTGEFNTYVYKGSPGSYSNALNVDTRLVYLITASAPQDGTTSNEAYSSVDSPHLVSQTDFTHTSSRFYTQDDVTALDGTTHYYYYSPVITTYVADMSDTFNRANNPIGQTSTGLQYNSFKSNYSNSWYVTSNKAWSSQSVSSNSPSNPTSVIEAGGRAEIIGGLSYPDNGGGYGIAFWVTAANSWWAASTYYNQSTALGCTGTEVTGLSSCSNGSNLGDYCSCTSYTASESTCTYTTGSSCPSSYCGYCVTVTIPATCSVSVSGTGFCPSAGTGPGDRCSANCSTGCNSGPTNKSTNTLGTGIGDSCSCSGPYANTTYSCGPLQTHTGCPLDFAFSPYGAGDVGRRCSSCIFLSGNQYLYSVVVQSSSTYYSCYSNGYSYTAYSNTSTGKEYGVSGTTDVTRYKSKTNQNTTTYKSYLNVHSSNGSSVTSQGSIEVASSTSGYINIPRLSMFTSGNSIYVSAYNGSIQIGNTLAVSGSKPSAGAGGVSAGLIKMNTPYNEAPYVDDLILYPSV